jgi:hypothetical protein
MRLGIVALIFSCICLLSSPAAWPEDSYRTGKIVKVTTQSRGEASPGSIAPPQDDGSPQPRLPRRPYGTVSELWIKSGGSVYVGRVISPNFNPQQYPPQMAVSIRVNGQRMYVKGDRTELETSLVRIQRKPQGESTRDQKH